LARKCDKTLKIVKETLKSEFKSKDLGELHYFLGIKVTRTKGGMFLSNEAYLRGILERFRMNDSKPTAAALLDVNPPRNPKGPCIVECKPNRELIGCLMYAVLTTRPDLSVAVDFYSRFQSNAREQQWNGLRKVLRYIKETIKYGLFYPRKGVLNKPLLGYADADWANDTTDRKSTSGYLFEVFRAVVSSNSKKQSVVALSSTEAEFLALSAAACEFISLKNVLTDLKVDISLPVTIFEETNLYA